ncbi:hypothetical protein psyc5s11_46570 [Clostridium gelidum]|uniref:Basal-body rod modification protein FlgD n=1 Tax=Clostridium gelidum TaxID=704125 RepID=A0ABN6J4Z0_9CLOT|nr:flagellar hook capping FlgD N-terminal domain-containing protein [Clostridium gelidum]BCZ48590.1 hypothetical protein psyc5s11_46570 [Clostridium gelidum]
MGNSVNAFNDSTINVPTSGITENGTKIRRRTDSTMDKNAFLKILSAQLSHLDPSQNQDSTAYVTQMAQFTSMEQMQNLNTTMSNSAYQQMVGKTVITNETNDKNEYIQGYVTEVIKKSGGTYFKMQIDGKEKEISAENVIGTVQANDTDAISNSNAISNGKTAINSDFLAASALAGGQKSVVIGSTGTDNKITFVKGKVTGAYIDGVSAKVKIKVDVLDAENNTANKTYNYDDIIKAGDLTPDEMTATIKEVEAALAKTAADKAAADAAAKTTSSSTSTGA